MGEAPPDKAFWQNRYRDRHTPWDLGAVSRPVQTLVQRWFPPEGRVLVPGCGRGYEAVWLARQGYAVTAVDLVPEPLADLRRMAEAAGVPVEIVQADMLALPAEYDGAFAVFLEQTCLCALPPSRHDDYARLAWRVLRPEGQLLGVFMEVPFDDGPPYNCPPEWVYGLFPPERWQREGPEPVQPPNPERPGPEYLARFVRRG